MDRARQAGPDRHHRRRYAYRLAPAAAALLAVIGCKDLTSVPDRVIAIEVTTTTPKVEEGDTLRLAARALNGLGNAVSGAAIFWAAADSNIGFTLDSVSGLVDATKPGSWRVIACTLPCHEKEHNLRSDPLTLTVTPQPDSVASSTTRVTLPAVETVSPPLAVIVYDATTTPGTLAGISGKAVAFQVVLPATGGGFFLTRDSLPGADPRAATATTGITGVAQITARRTTGQTQPDSAIIEARVTTARAVAVAGSPIRFVILFPTN